jgi:hypothetical protein
MSLFEKDRFDLESAMNEVRTTARDIQIVADMIYDSSLIYDTDRIHTVLSGLAETLEAKCERAEDIFCQVYKLNQYAPTEVQALREKYFGMLNEQENSD